MLVDPPSASSSAKAEDPGDALAIGLDTPLSRSMTEERAEYRGGESRVPQRREQSTAEERAESAEGRAEYDGGSNGA